MRTLIFIAIAVACLHAAPEIISNYRFLDSLYYIDTTGGVETEYWDGESIAVATAWSA